jgi:release factor glutamine methyltransferase
MGNDAMTLAERVAAGRARLGSAGIAAADAAVDAEVLARHLLGWDRARYVADARAEPPAWFEEAYREWLDRRVKREPVSLITGMREFYGLDFEVSPDVLTPRPETELVVEQALACAAEREAALRRPLVIVDVGTGSGCLAISLARQLREAPVTGTDISRAALAVARRNAARHGVAARVTFICTSLLEAIAAPVDLVVSNPPYVQAADMTTLPPEVRNYEPAVALAGGTDGLDVIRALVAQCDEVLAPGGWVVFEFGHGQAQGVRAAVDAWPRLRLARVCADLQGIPRVAAVQRTP